MAAVGSEVAVVVSSEAEAMAMVYPVVEATGSAALAKATAQRTRSSTQTSQGTCRDTSERRSRSCRSPL